MIARLKRATKRRPNAFHYRVMVNPYYRTWRVMRLRRKWTRRNGPCHYWKEGKF